MGIYGGLMGPKSENVEKVLVLPLLFEGSRGARPPQPNEQVSGPEHAWAILRSKKCVCWLQLFYGFIYNCVSYSSGEHIFRKIVKQKWEKSCKKSSEREKWSQKRLDGKCDGYMRGADGAKKRKCWKSIGFTTTFWRVKGGMRTPTERTTERPGAFLGRFEVKKIWFLIKDALWLYTELCLLL